jgi:uncharacterized protein (TIGR02246 family)
MKPRTPEECDAQFERYLDAGDLDGLATLYEAQAVLVQMDGTLAVGPAAIREGLAPLFAMKARIRMNVTRTVRTGDDLATLYNDWTLQATGPDGASITSTGKAIEVVRRQPDGTWRYAFDDPNGRG